MNRRTYLALASTGIASLAGCSDVFGNGTPIDAPCPTFDDADRTICAHTADDPPALLDPGRWTVTEGRQTVLRFTLTNRTDDEVTFNPQPTLERREDGDWTRVAPLVRSADSKALRPDGEFDWRLVFGTLPDRVSSTGSGNATESGRTTESRQTTSDAYTVPALGLDAGLCALTVSVSLAGDAIRCVAPFRVTAAGTTTDG
ncbi:hypothetical protein [Halomicrococcus sp. NG-SE-24]|uniref:hypothetical protein n=1 Tax=Halomicrococcus sp. NG-SE-24 TaxID=3436928 RepID=UPI003D96388F